MERIVIYSYIYIYNFISDNVYSYVYIYEYICDTIYSYTYMDIHTYCHIYEDLYICIHHHIWQCLSICIFISIEFHIWQCLFIFIYKYMNIYVTISIPMCWHQLQASNSIPWLTYMKIHIYEYKHDGYIFPCTYINRHIFLHMY